MTESADAAARLAEALVFASAEPVSTAAVARLLPPPAEAGTVLRALQAQYAGRGVELVEVAGGWQFRTAPDLAPRLTQVVPQPRRLPRAAMEALAAGVPVVARPLPVLREVFADHVRYGEEPTTIATALLRAVVEGPLPGGAALAERHTWRAAAEQHLDLYRSLTR